MAGPTDSEARTLRSSAIGHQTHCDLEPLKPSNSSEEPSQFPCPGSEHRPPLEPWEAEGKQTVGEMYVSGAPNSNRNIAVIRKAKTFTIHSVVRWLDAQLPSHLNLKVLYRPLSPRHSFNGEWNTGGTCDNTDPLAKGNAVFRDHSEDAATERAVRGTRITLMAITAPEGPRALGYQGTVSGLHRGFKIACIGAFLVFQTHGMRSWLLNCCKLPAARTGKEVPVELASFEKLFSSYLKL